jgi:hypothetical protein
MELSTIWFVFECWMFERMSNKTFSKKKVRTSLQRSQQTPGTFVTEWPTDNSWFRVTSLFSRISNGKLRQVDFDKFDSTKMVFVNLLISLYLNNILKH